MSLRLSSSAVATATMSLLSAATLSAQNPTQNPQRQAPASRTPRQHVVTCVPGDSTRAYRRSVGDAPAGTTPIQGGTARSREYPEYDVVLDIPNVCVERIFLKVDSLTAKLQLDARVANLVRVQAGADVLIGNVDLTIQDVRASALLLVDLDDVVHVVDNTLTFVDNHPEIVSQLSSTLQNTGAAAGGLVGGLVRGLLLSTEKLANGNVLQHVVDQATGSLIDRTLSSAGKVLAEKTIGSVLDLATIKESTNAAGQIVRQVRDKAGALIEYTLDKATNKISAVRVLSQAAGVTR